MGRTLRPGEGPLVLWAAAWFFSLLASYFLLRPLRESFGLDGGLDTLPWLFLTTLAVMLVANPIYGAVVSRVPRARFVRGVHGFFQASMLLFTALLLLVPPAGSVWIGRAFFVWVSVFNLFAVAVFWSLLADSFTVEQGRRLYGWIGVGGTAGALAGAGLATLLPAVADGTGVDVAQLAAWMPCATALLLEVARRCEGRLERAADGLARERGQADGSAGLAGERVGGQALDGLREIARSPYLLGVCLYLFLGTLTGTLLYFMQAGIVDARFATRGERIAAFGQIDVCVQGATLLIQLFFTARVLGSMGVGFTLALLPVVSAGGFAGLLALSSFPVLFGAQVTRRSSQFALAKPARELLFNVLTRSEKYKAKAAIDTFVYRLGDTLGALLALGLGAATTGATFAGVLALSLCALWWITAMALGRAQAARARRGLPAPT